MCQMGSGLEYRVFDQGGGRVLKIRRGAYNRVLRTFLYSIRSGEIEVWPRILRHLMPATNEVPALASRLSAMPPETRRLFGNIEIVRKNDYTQDLVTPLRDYFAAHSLEKNVARVQEYVGLVRELWSLGIGDPYFNFPWNAGVYPDGLVIQIDVADLTSDAAFIGESTRRQKWLETGVPGIENKELRRECARILNTGFAYETFLDIWPVAAGTHTESQRGILAERRP